MERNIYEWYVVYTRPGMEIKVARELSKKQIECYCPISKSVNKWWGLGKQKQPLFTSRIFVKVSEKDIVGLRKNEGVVNVLYWLGKPVTVKEEEILSIKDFINTYSNIVVENTEVRAENYAFTTSTEVNGQSAGTYKLDLSNIGYRISAASLQEGKIITMNSNIKGHSFTHKYSNAG